MARITLATGLSGPAVTGVRLPATDGVDGREEEPRLP